MVSLPAPLDMSTDQHHSHDGSELSPRTTEEVATPTLTASAVRCAARPCPLAMGSAAERTIGPTTLPGAVTSQTEESAVRA